VKFTDSLSSLVVVTLDYKMSFLQIFLDQLLVFQLFYL